MRTDFLSVSEVPPLWGNILFLIDPFTRIQSTGNNLLRVVGKGPDLTSTSPSQILLCHKIVYKHLRKQRIRLVLRFVSLSQCIV